MFKLDSAQVQPSPNQIIIVPFAITKITFLNTSNSIYHENNETGSALTLCLSQISENFLNFYL